ncbi:capsular polysaccharide transport system permease protein [Monaibacterium marinum]|uniref:Capsular polysaccharide transport system permease protein n=1 Tax=Pontivivens marinum TaxID=1690039 RepID=A0A2C9CNK2_9RHOB|nr:capsule biosynthesis protein [Monaibacterium marinum]SOH92765.1 capsular polysaccharide transport system permease protein [Monaibacterium marinum]
MTTPADQPDPSEPVDKDKAEVMARRARRRARKLMNEADSWEEHSASDGKVPPPVDGSSPIKKRQDVMSVINAQMRAEQQKSDENENIQLPAKQREQGVAKVEPGPANAPPIDPRDAEILEIQRELVRRRRRRFILLWLRLAFFVVLPTALVGNYYFNYATPFYSSTSNVLLNPAAASLNSESATGVTASANLLRDSIAIQDFLTSREAMRILDQDLGIVGHYSDTSIDPIQRLAADASENEAYALYKDRVLIGFDLLEGILRIEVIAATPDMAYAISNRLIELAEQRVDTMSDRNQQNALASAQLVLETAEAGLEEAYERVLTLQEQRGIFSAELEVGLVQAQISGLTTALEERRLSLAALQDNARPNPAQVRVLNAEIARLEEAISEQRQLVVSAQTERTSLARISAEMAQAEQQLATRNLMVESAVAGLELARRDASQQLMFLARAVNPVRPVVPSYPRALEYTVLAFVIFFAAYMMVSLTISILREQMSYGD